MTNQQLAEIIEEMVPHLYLNRNSYDIEWGRKIELILEGNIYTYISYETAGRGGSIGVLFNYIEMESFNYCKLDLNSFELERVYVYRDICTKWLEINTKICQKDWSSILDILEFLKNRTYENMPVITNFVLDPGVKGSIPITNKDDIKLFDLLAGSNYTYFLVDKELKIVDYDCISWSETTDKKDYSSLPNFLQPYSHLLIDKYGISLTHAGDIIIYNNLGMIMSIRKERWTMYENALTKNLYRDILKSTNYGVACNLFDIVWDLSYRRHGALIITTPDDDYESHIVNKDSILARTSFVGFRQQLFSTFKKISLKKRGEICKRSLFLELSSVDGAIIVDGVDGSVKAFGAIIETAPNISATTGARTTAAKSAISYEKMSPIKVSSDGDITLYTRQKEKNSGEDVVLEYKFF